MPPSNKDDIIRIRVESHLKQAAEEMAEDRGEALAVIVRGLLRRAIEDWREKNTPAQPPGRVTYPMPDEAGPSSRLNEPGPDERESG